MRGGREGESEEVFVISHWDLGRPSSRPLACSGQAWALSLQCDPTRRARLPSAFPTPSAARARTST
eukprot:684769-Hanusia_phi.AAC.1